MSRGTKKTRVGFRLNGAQVTVEVHPMKRLLDLLREEGKALGVKEGCGEGECGACTVLLDGKPVLACMVPAIQAEGREVKTVEGLGTPERLHPLQRAFLEEGGAQCGICTPGMLVSAAYWLEHPESAEDLREALAGNQCRCTGYTKIFTSVEKAARTARPK